MHPWPIAWPIAWPIGVARRSSVLVPLGAIGESVKISAWVIAPFPFSPFSCACWLSPIHREMAACMHLNLVPPIRPREHVLPSRPRERGTEFGLERRWMARLLALVGPSRHAGCPNREIACLTYMGRAPGTPPRYYPPHHPFLGPRTDGDGDGTRPCLQAVVGQASTTNAIHRKRYVETFIQYVPSRCHNTKSVITSGRPRHSLEGTALQDAARDFGRRAR